MDLTLSWVAASYLPPPRRVLVLGDKTPILCRERCMVALSSANLWQVSRMCSGVSGAPQMSQLGSSAKENLWRLSLSLEWPMRSLAMAVSHLLFL